MIRCSVGLILLETTTVLLSPASHCQTMNPPDSRAFPSWCVLPPRAQSFVPHGESSALQLLIVLKLVWMTLFLNGRWVERTSTQEFFRCFLLSVRTQILPFQSVTYNLVSKTKFKALDGSLLVYYVDMRNSN